MPQPDFDLQATIARLFVYPVKSCAGVELPEVLLTETGLEFDRAWMVVDARGEFVTQRELPRMALIRPQLKHPEVVLRAPGMLALHLAFDRVEKPVRVRVWKDEVAAYDMGDIAAQWFSDFLSEPGKPQALRLVRFDPEHKRLSSLEWTGGIEAENQFADGYPLLVASEGSLAELKPVKPCTRCPIPDIDPATATCSPEVGDMLLNYRADARVDGRITFGMNCIVLQGVEHMLKVGQPVGANYRFE